MLEDWQPEQCLVIYRINCGRGCSRGVQGSVLRIANYSPSVHMSGLVLYSGRSGTSTGSWTLPRVLRSGKS